MRLLLLDCGLKSLKKKIGFTRLFQPIFRWIFLFHSFIPISFIFHRFLFLFMPIQIPLLCRIPLSQSFFSHALYATIIQIRWWLLLLLINVMNPITLSLSCSQAQHFLTCLSAYSKWKHSILYKWTDYSHEQEKPKSLPWFHQASIHYSNLLTSLSFAFNMISFAIIWKWKIKRT